MISLSTFKDRSRLFISYCVWFIQPPCARDREKNKLMSRESQASALSITPKRLRQRSPEFFFSRINKFNQFRPICRRAKIVLREHSSLPFRWMRWMMGLLGFQKALFWVDSFWPKVHPIITFHLLAKKTLRCQEGWINWVISVAGMTEYSVNVLLTHLSKTVCLVFTELVMLFQNMLRKLLTSPSSFLNWL